MNNRKFKVCEFETSMGSPIAIDPMDIVAIGVGPVDEPVDDGEEESDEPAVETQVFTTDGAYWRIKESYIEAQQVWIDARTNNILLEFGDL